VLQVVRVLASEPQGLAVQISDLTVFLKHLNLEAKDFPGVYKQSNVRPFADSFMPDTQYQPITFADVVYISMDRQFDQTHTLKNLTRLQMEFFNKGSNSMLYTPFIFRFLTTVATDALKHGTPLELCLSISMLTQLFVMATPSENVSLRIVEEIMKHVDRGKPLGDLIDIVIYRLMAVVNKVYPLLLPSLNEAEIRRRVAEIAETIDTEGLPDLLARAFLDKPGDSRCFEMKSTTSPATMFLYRDTSPSMASNFGMVFIQNESGERVLYQGSLDMGFTHQGHEWIITLRISDGEVFGRVESVNIWEFLEFWDQRRSDDMKRLFLRAYYYERDDKSATDDDDDDDDGDIELSD